MENERADVSIATNRTYIEKMKSTLPAGTCLAWVVPHVYYVSQGAAATAVTRQWNQQMAALLKAELAPMKCHALVPWNSVVDAYTAKTSGLTAAQKKAAEPLLYDGRHPTQLGRIVLADTVARALHR
jgi:hypothetical protein